MLCVCLCVQSPALRFFSFLILSRLLRCVCVCVCKYAAMWSNSHQLPYYSLVPLCIFSVSLYRSRSFMRFIAHTHNILPWQIVIWICARAFVPFFKQFFFMNYNRQQIISGSIQPTTTINVQQTHYKCIHLCNFCIYFSLVLFNTAFYIEAMLTAIDRWWVAQLFVLFLNRWIVECVDSFHQNPCVVACEFYFTSQ